MNEEQTDHRPNNVVGFYQPDAKARIREASEAGLRAMFEHLLDKRDRLNEYEIEGAFCAMIQAHFDYMRTQEGRERARELFERFHIMLRSVMEDTLSADIPASEAD